MSPYVYEINLFGWFHLIYFGLAIPFFALRHARKFHGGGALPNRRSHFQKTAFTLVMFAVISLMVARGQGMDLFPRRLPDWRAILASVIVLIAMVGFMRPRWRAAVERRGRVIYLYMPTNAAERFWWITVAVLAGVCEEITWRGVQTGLLINLTRSVWVAIIASAISFAVAHAVQGWKSVAVVALFALAFQLLVWLAGSLYVAMAAHVIYDIIAGISYGRMGKELGYDLKRDA
jgi:membrane protease YdiL (CAAX protease family)